MEWSSSSAARSAASWSISIAPRTACSASWLQGTCRSTDSTVEKLAGDTDVIPGRLLPVRIPEQRRRVVGHYQRDSMVRMHLPAQVRKTPLGLEQRFGSGSAQGDHYFGADQGNLPLEVRETSGHFLGQRLPVLGWPAFHHIGDENFFPREPDRRQNLGQQLPRPTHEG